MISDRFRWRKRGGPRGCKRTSLSCLSISLLRAFSSSVISTVGIGAERHEPMARMGGMMVEWRKEMGKRPKGGNCVGSWPCLTKLIRLSGAILQTQFSFNFNSWIPFSPNFYLLVRPPLFGKGRFVSPRAKLITVGRSDVTFSSFCYV